jgi:hypothetical protein
MLKICKENPTPNFELGLIEYVEAVTLIRNILNLALIYNTC